MSSFPSKRLATGAVLLSSSFFVGLPANAQAANYPVGAVVQSLREDPGSALARHLRDLNTSPSNLTSLLGAGNAALEVGDPQTALTFFARAEEVAPRDGRVKAGMGSAFVQTEQAQAALKFFAEAATMGAPVSSFAKDRGLAYDMIGDNARAQADYAIALQFGSDPEVERRLALSRAIAGDQEGALAVLSRQVSRGDRAGYRARAFVLALTGDAAGASRAVEAVMPAQANAMRPFLARLPDLGPADRAMAVHFGRFPQGQAYAYSNGRYAQNQAVTPATAGRPDAAQPALGGSPARTQPTRNQQPAPGSRTQRASKGATKPVQIKAQPVPSQPAPAPIQVGPQQIQSQPVQPQPVQPQPVQPSMIEEAQPSAFLPAATSDAGAGSSPLQTAQLPPSSVALDQPVDTSPAVDTSIEAPASEPAAVEAAPAQPSSASSFDFNDVVSAVQSLPSADTGGDREPVQLAETKKPAPAKPAAAKPPSEKKAAPAKPQEPSRVWIQLAAAQDKSAFPGEFRRLKTKAAKLLSDKTAWTAPLGRTNRLLIGPFKTETEARELVNQLSKVEIASYSWVSQAGQKIEKLPAK